MTNGDRTVEADPSRSTQTNWRQIRGDRALSAPGRFHFSVRADSLRHAELVLGAVDPERAPKTPYCLHSSKPADGVFIRFFSFGAVAEGDTLTALIDMDARRLTFARNGVACADVAPMELPERVVPVLELYGHDHPRVTLTGL